jgi:hypothetical protein
MAIKGDFRRPSRRKSAARAAASTAFEKENGGGTLIDAVKFGDKKALKRLLGRSDTNLEETNDRGETALILAALLGDYEAVQLLVESGALVNAKSTLSITALMAAAQNGDIAALRYLLTKGADPDARKKDGTTILMIAAMFGHAECVQALLEAGVDITAEDIYGYTALTLAAGCEECEEILTAAEARTAEMHTEDKPAENTETTRAAVSGGSLKKALVTASKKDRKPRHAPRQEKPQKEKPAGKATKPPA